MAFPPMPPVFHPILVHFTIGLVPAAAAFATYAAWRRSPAARKAAEALLAAVAVLSLATMASGFRDYFAVEGELEGTEAGAALEWHERLGVVTTLTLVVTALVAWWRREDLALSDRWRWALAIALLAATALVVVTGWFGGSLVYDHGIATPGGVVEP